jgi:hypothetical protein
MRELSSRHVLGDIRCELDYSVHGMSRGELLRKHGAVSDVGVMRCGPILNRIVVSLHELPCGSVCVEYRIDRMCELWNREIRSSVDIFELYELPSGLL